MGMTNTAAPQADELAAHIVALKEALNIRSPRSASPLPWKAAAITYAYDWSHALLWCDTSKTGEHWRRLDGRDGKNCGRFTDADASLIVAAVNAAPVLLAHIERQAAAVAELVEGLRDAADMLRGAGRPRSAATMKALADMHGGAR